VRKSFSRQAGTQTLSIVKATVDRMTLQTIAAAHTRRRSVSKGSGERVPEHATNATWAAKNLWESKKRQVESA
jgi:hypothetical protein